jgi:hypothetical protein
LKHSPVKFAVLAAGALTASALLPGSALAASLPRPAQPDALTVTINKATVKGPGAGKQEYKSVTATCPDPLSRAVGGGAQSSGMITGDYPSGPRAWTATAEVRGNSVLTSYVTCAVGDLTASIQTAPITPLKTGNLQNSAGTVRCPGLTANAVSGGYQVPGGTPVSDVQRSAPNAWTVTTGLYGHVQGTAYAVCTSLALDLTVPTKVVKGGRNSNPVTVACTRSDETAIGGGYYDSNGVYPVASYPAGKLGYAWTVSLVQPGSYAAVTAKVFAVCALDV